jgi:hypothetical protein
MDAPMDLLVNGCDRLYEGEEMTVLAMGDGFIIEVPARIR